ncbi:hypothetical protein [Xanthomonas vesicatoria]|uniref:hypothetical protein n=1 Tax=Xanthomonas vesicatoria TaxID=56460 RepID=UPI00241271B7|nr:hypothetical protein [Xanthomonas vesicatoria]
MGKNVCRYAVNKRRFVHLASAQVVRRTKELEIIADKGAISGIAQCNPLALRTPATAGTDGALAHERGAAGPQVGGQQFASRSGACIHQRDERLVHSDAAAAGIVLQRFQVHIPGVPDALISYVFTGWRPVSAQANPPMLPRKSMSMTSERAATAA